MSARITAEGGWDTVIKDRLGGTLKETGGREDFLKKVQKWGGGGKKREGYN